MHRTIVSAIVATPLTVFAASQDDAVRAALDAVAKDAGVSRTTLRIVSAQPATWPDARMGCQQAGKAPEGAPRSGYRVLVRSNNDVHIVHVGEDAAVHCITQFQAASAPPSEVTPMPGDPTAPPADRKSHVWVVKARDDLAQRLSVSADDIVLVEFKPMVWPDASYGCPRPGINYPQVQREGVLIRLEAKGKVYAYHGGSGRDPFLCESSKV